MPRKAERPGQLLKITVQRSRFPVPASGACLAAALGLMGFVDPDDEDGVVVAHPSPVAVSSDSGDLGQPRFDLRGLLCRKVKVRWGRDREVAPGRDASRTPRTDTGRDVESPVQGWSNPPAADAPTPIGNGARQ